MPVVPTSQTLPRARGPWGRTGAGAARRIEITGTFKHQSTLPAGRDGRGPGCGGPPYADAGACAASVDNGARGFLVTEVALRNEGIDPSKLKDKLFMFNQQTKAYEPFGPEQYTQLVAGKARL